MKKFFYIVFFAESSLCVEKRAALKFSSGQKNLILLIVKIKCSQTTTEAITVYIGRSRRRWRRWWKKITSIPTLKAWRVWWTQQQQHKLRALIYANRPRHWIFLTRSMHTITHPLLSYLSLAPPLVVIIWLNVLRVISQTNNLHLLLGFYSRVILFIFFLSLLTTLAKKISN